MRSGWILSITVASLGLAMGTATLLAEKEAAALKIKDVMGKYVKGDKSPLAKALKGESSEAELKELHAAFVALAGNKPPKGDEEAWKKKTEALVAASAALAEKKEGAVAALKAATNCKACHDDHKGK